jgi:hypothetical protein
MAAGSSQSPSVATPPSPPDSVPNALIARIAVQQTCSRSTKGQSGHRISRLWLAMLPVHTETLSLTLTKIVRGITMGTENRRPQYETRFW